MFLGHIGGDPTQRQRYLAMAIDYRSTAHE